MNFFQIRCSEQLKKSHHFSKIILETGTAGIDNNLQCMRQVWLTWQGLLHWSFSDTFLPVYLQKPVFFLQMVELESGSEEGSFAKKSLFARHPQMKDWPSSHGKYNSKNNSIIVLLYYYSTVVGLLRQFSIDVKMKCTVIHIASVTYFHCSFVHTLVSKISKSYTQRSTC